MQIFDTVVIGSGPCSEPVLFHLSKTKLNCLIIDAGNINKSYENIDKTKNKHFNSKLTPKQKLDQFKWFDNKYYQKINEFLFISCKRFCYVYSFKSGGLSNSWGGGAFEWSPKDIKKTTSISSSAILKSYKMIRERLIIKKRNTFSSFSKLANILLKDNNNVIDFKEAQFFLNKKYKHKSKNFPFNQNLIWNSKNTIRGYIKSSSNLKYKKDTMVLSLKRKKNNLWEICCKEKENIIFIHTRSIILCSGTFNSACLAFSASKLQNINLNLNHNNAFIIPILFFRRKVGSLSTDYLEIHELSWKEKIKKRNNNYNISSGYFLNSTFIFKEILNKFHIKKKNIIFKLISYVLSRFGFITIFMPSNFSNVSLKLKKISIPNRNKVIYAKISNESNKKLLEKKKLQILRNLVDSFPKKIYFLSFFKRSVIPGGDIHYSSTLPDKISGNKYLTTSSIGEINELPMIFSADPSRLAYLSSLPHTFTTMAINDASMPEVINKIIDK